MKTILVSLIVIPSLWVSARAAEPLSATSAAPSGNQWAQLAQLTASNGRGDDQMGASVAISGSTAVVGAPGARKASGAAYVFVKPVSGWGDSAQTAELTASGPEGLLGLSVAIGGDTAVVGAPGANNDQGAAYVFVKPKSGWKNMTQDRQTVLPCKRERLLWWFGVRERRDHRDRGGWCGVRIRQASRRLAEHDPDCEANRLRRNGRRLVPPRLSRQ